MNKKDINLNEVIIQIRVSLQEKMLKKSGKNSFMKFNYFELKDFLPDLQKLMLENGVNDRFYIKYDYAVLELIKGEEKQEYSIPFIPYETPENKGRKTMQDIQYLGALNTYYKRYLYLNAFGIVENDIIDSLDNKKIFEEKKVVKKEDHNLKTKKQIKENVNKYAKILEIDEKEAYARLKIEKTDDVNVLNDYLDASDLAIKNAIMIKNFKEGKGA